jgi:hypothetical protein
MKAPDRMNFQGLLRNGIFDPEKSQRFARDHLPEVVALHRMHLGQSGEPFIVTGERFLLGVVTWSIYNLQLLDELAVRIREGRFPADRLDLDVIHTPENIEPYIPGLSARFFNPPDLGIWADGILRERLDGHKARQRLLSASAG